MTDAPPNTGPDLRQVTLVVEDLDKALLELRKTLGLNPGFRDTAVAERYDLVQEVLAVGRTYLELLSPNPPLEESAAGRFLLRNGGDGGYILSVQVPELASVKERLRGAGYEPVLDEVWEGSPVAQWHPREFGTLLEVDQLEPGKEWHFPASLHESARTDIIQRIVAAEIATPEPRELARRWGLIIDQEPEEAVLELRSTRVAFIDSAGGPPGLRRIEIESSGAGVEPAVFAAGGVEILVRRAPGPPD